MNHSEQSHLTSARRDLASDAVWRDLHRRASAPYRAAGTFAWYFARGKLGHDPVFRCLLERGDLRSGRIVDIGCGQGLMASLLQACSDIHHAGRWPAAWPQTPRATAYTGIELMQRDVQRAERAAGGLALAPKFVCGDMRSAPLPPCDTVVILDVLHYVDHAAQLQVLQRVHTALQPHGRLLLRVGDQADRRAFRISQWVDTAVTLVRGHGAPPRACRTVAAWIALLHDLGFSVRSTPMSAGTPFANVLLVADLR